MASLSVSVGVSTTLRVARADSRCFGGNVAECLGVKMHPARNGFVTRRGNVTAKASEEEKGVPLWRKELSSLEDPSGENLLQSTSMEEDIARLQKKRELEKRVESYNQGKKGEQQTEGEGMTKSVIEKILVADFFFILFILAWLVAGLVERSALSSTTLIDSWLPLWASVFQPALGVFMAGAIVSAVSGYLSKSANK